MHLLGTLAVLPVLPDRLRRLGEIAMNLWWSWNPQAVALMRDLGGTAWEESEHNPVRLLGIIGQSRLDRLAADAAFLSRLERVLEDFDTYMNPAQTWFSCTFPTLTHERFAYFSAEFGLHESLPIYSGGLGILSGDHCKSASDLGIPLVGVGLLYNQGYFQQQISSEGVQEVVYAALDFSQMPIARATDAEGRPVHISVEMPERTTQVRVWKVQVGRVPVYLLDTDISQNSSDDRRLSAQLYGGDRDTRISQEIVLGMGGVRALQALGVKATVFHMNEGHSAFLGLERIRSLMQAERMPYPAALEAVAASTVFTTHTPVPAGHDAFSHEMMDRYFSRYLDATGISRAHLFELGASAHEYGTFSMTALALHISRHANGVSRLHERVSRELWRHMWEGFDDQELPIGHITNGVHVGSWQAPEISALLTTAAGHDERVRQTEPERWRKATDGMRDADLWQAHTSVKIRMITNVRSRLCARLRRLGRSNAMVRDIESLLDPQVLTLGFARRFATYKRATLLLRDPERLLRILTNPQRPVQLIFAGKAHPADDPGKSFIRQLHDISQDPRFNRHIVLVEGYDMHLARHLVSGVDVWMNTPRRPLEACGTSGQKAALNGAINFSVLDGWWDEGYDGDNGWTIGERQDHDDLEEQDRIDSLSIYDTLEREIVPLYYARDDDGLPVGWLRKMRASMASCGPRFNTDRMLEDYTRQLYIPALRSGQMRLADHGEAARELAAWKDRVRALWHQVQIEASAPCAGDIRVGEALELTARAHLGDLTPEDVAIELFVAPLHDGALGAPRIIEMETKRGGDGIIDCSARFTPESNGSHAFGVRAVPRNPSLVNRVEMGLVHWA